MDRVAALVLAGGRGHDFGALSEHRTKAAFPVAGYYRIIDFVLSNLCHAGIRQAGVIIQYMPASLMEHIGSGRPWEFDMADRSLRFMTPFVGVDEIRWFHGTGDAIAKNINLIPMSDLDDVLILSADHVYRMDYRELISYHRKTGADVTFACVEIPTDQQHPRFGNVVADPSGRVQAFLEKPEQPVSPLVSMGVYCVRREVLLDLLARAEQTGLPPDFSLAGDILQPQVGRLNAQAWVFNRPWYYLANLREYFLFHMALAGGQVHLFDEGWDIITNFSDRNLSSRTPAFFGATAEVDSSIISSGCTINGKVVNSVLSPGVRVAAGAEVRNCLIFHDVTIGEGCHLQNVIIDKDVIVEAEAQIGMQAGGLPLAPEAHVLSILPKGCRVAPGEVCPAGYMVDSSVLA